MDTCPVCGGKGWVEARPIVQRVTGDGEKAFVASRAAIVPCFACFGKVA